MVILCLILIGIYWVWEIIIMFFKGKVEYYLFIREYVFFDVIDDLLLLDILLLF